MSSAIVACKTISNEVRKAITEAHVTHPVIWIESGLHNWPDKLRQKLQEQISCIDNVEYIIMAFGYCGNSLLGIESPNAKLVIPRVDDCISLLLGSYQKRQQMAAEMGTYFLTKGWMDYENNILEEYERCIERYGKEKADRVMKIMLENYKRLALIDTGAYDLDDCLGRSCGFACKLGLRHEVVPGSLDLLKKLLSGPWDEDFLIIPQGEALTFDHFRTDLPRSDLASSQTSMTFGFSS
jgi:hypothetical protein